MCRVVSRVARAISRTAAVVVLEPFGSSCLARGPMHSGDGASRHAAAVSPIPQPNTLGVHSASRDPVAVPPRALSATPALRNPTLVLVAGTLTLLHGARSPLFGALALPSGAVTPLAGALTSCGG
jgi:hypothetical protein